MNKDLNRPKVGVGVMIYNAEGQVLLGKRFNAHGEGCWSSPGGHLEGGETPEACAKRETLEETGLEIIDLERVTYTNDVFQKESLHYVTLFLKANALHGEPEAREPHKCPEWKWFDVDKLPEPLFLPVKHLVEQVGLEALILAK